MKKNRLSVLLASVSLFLCSVLLSGCGGGGGDGGSSSGGSTAPTVKTGVFADAPVDGIDYKTATQTGVTTNGGQFKYMDGETVAFSIGNTALGAKTAKPVLTPVDLVAGATDQTDPKVTKIVQLILSLADNPNAATLKIGAANLAAMKAASPMDFSMDQSRFETAINLVTKATPVSSTTAQSHMAATLGTANSNTATTPVTTLPVTLANIAGNWQTTTGVNFTIDATGKVSNLALTTPGATSCLSNLSWVATFDAFQINPDFTFSGSYYSAYVSAGITSSGHPQYNSTVSGKFSATDTVTITFDNTMVMPVCSDKTKTTIVATKTSGSNITSGDTSTGSGTTPPPTSSPIVQPAPVTSEYYCRDGTSSTGCSNWYPLAKYKVYVSNTSCSDASLKQRFGATNGWGNTPITVGTASYGSCVAIP